MHPSPEEIRQAILDIDERATPFAVALVLNAEGSTPRKAGARAILFSDGRIRGTIGGGAVEAEAQRRAAEVIEQGQPLVFDFRLQGDGVGDSSPICGGMMRMLLDPHPERHRAAYVEAGSTLSRRGRGILLTTVMDGPAPTVQVRFIAEKDIPSQTGFPGPAALSAAAGKEAPQYLVSNAETLEGQVEWLAPPPLVVIAGGGHVGQAVAEQASLVGFEVCVVDDRQEFVEPRLYPAGTKTVCADISAALGGLASDSDTYFVLVTRGHRHDAEALAACLRKPAAYVGMIGSRRKVALMRQEFIAAGRATPEEFDRVYAPIGLDIGAETVPEIAASIVAQLIAVRRQGRAPRLSAGAKP